MKKILLKLSEVKKEMEAVKKTSDNPYFSSKYADLNSYLDVVEPLLEKHKMILLQPCVLRDDGKQVVRSAIHDLESDEVVKSDLELMVEKKDMQKLGSAITYARRYSLAALLSMKAEDDDGESSVSNRKPSNKNKFKKKKKVQDDEDDDF